MHENVNKIVMFAEAFTATIYAVVVAISNAVVGIFTYLLALHNSKHDKQKEKQEKIDAAKQKIDEVCDKGSLSDLIDAAKDMKEARK